MSKLSKRGTLKDVDPEDIIIAAKTVVKIVRDLMKKDKDKNQNDKKQQMVIKKVLQLCHTDKIAALKLYEPYNYLRCPNLSSM